MRSFTITTSVISTGTATTVVSFDDADDAMNHYIKTLRVLAEDMEHERVLEATGKNSLLKALLVGQTELNLLLHGENTAIQFTITTRSN